MVDLHGKTALITGASAGIGLETAVALAGMGAAVVMVARDPARGEAARAEVAGRIGQTAASAVSLLTCDFSSQASIRRLAEAYRAAHTRLDILVNNAGGVNHKRKVSEDGIELTFAVNHLGYFLLTNLLLDLVVASAPARVVNVASVGHFRGDLDFDDLGFAKGGYSTMRAYGRSKLGNVLFTRELARRLEGKNVTVTCLHPGAVATKIWSSAPPVARPFLAVAKRLFMIPPAEGAARIVHLATSPAVEGSRGGYYDKNVEVPPARLARDEALARRLWDESERLVGLAA